MISEYFHHEPMATTRQKLAIQVPDAAGLNYSHQSNRSALALFRIYVSSSIGSDLADLRPETLKILAHADLRRNIIELAGLCYIREELPCMLPAALVRQVREEFGEAASEYFAYGSKFGTHWRSELTRSEVEEIGKLGLVRWISGFGEADASWIRLLVVHTGPIGSRLVDVKRLAELTRLAWDRLGGPRHVNN